jgi:hypothetical protein
VGLTDVHDRARAHRYDGLLVARSTDAFDDLW